MKILLTIEDISYGRGAERVTVNLANALSGGHEVTILSFYQRHPTLPYTNINPQVNLIFKYNYEQSIAQESAKKQFFKGLYYKNIHKILLSYEMRKANYDFVISSGFIYFPYFKNPKTRYIKIIHTNFHRYSSRNKYFDMLITLSNKELPLWQQYHKNVKMIPNFIPQIPQESTNYKQKVIISVGSLTAEKGFLRLLDIWGMVQEMIANPNANRKSPTSSLRGARSEASATKQSKSSDLKRQSESRIEKQINADSLQVRDSPKVQSLPDRLPRFGVAESRNDDRDSPSLAEGDTGGGFDSQNLTQWKLIIVGDGILKSEIESKIKALNLQDSIIIKPFTKDIESEYLSASIYAMASHFEGFGMVLAEASSYALPCIAFDIATGPSDIIEHNQSGFLIADNNLESYAKHLIKLMIDESMRERFGSEAKRIVRERFSKEVIMEKWRELFSESNKSMVESKI